MEWLKKQASAASAALESTMKESGVAEHLKPVAQAAGETGSLFKSIGSSLESSFNEVSKGWAAQLHSPPQTQTPRALSRSQPGE